MSQLLRGFYRIFIKNKIIRWAWMLGLCVWGVTWATENFLKTKNTFFSKTILSIAPEEVTAFTIRKGEDETTFVRTDSAWFVVKNDVTIRVPTDSVVIYLNLFSQMTSYAIKKLPENSGNNDESVDNTALFKIYISRKNNTTDSLSIFYTDMDSLSGKLLTYIKLPDERLLHGVEGDLTDLFDKDFNDFRNPLLFSFSKPLVSKISWQINLDTATFYVKDSANWTYFKEDYAVLNDSFSNYIHQFNNLSLLNTGILRGGKYYDAARDFKNMKNMVHQWVVFFENDSAVLTVYRKERYFILHSNQNPDTYIQIDSTDFLLKKPLDFVRLKKSVKSN